MEPNEGFLADLMPPFMVAVCPKGDGWLIIIYDMREVGPSNPKGIVNAHCEPNLKAAQEWATREMVGKGAITVDGLEAVLPWESLICD